MIRITTQGSGRDLAADVRAVHAQLVPYAAATALTRSAFAARDEVRSAMGRAFDQPVSYTLNSLRVERATARDLSAMIAVKDAAAGSGRPQQSYLLPEVEGGPRRATGLEKRLRYAGMLDAGSFAVPGSGARLDAAGNIPRSQLGSVLRAMATPKRGAKIFFAALGRRGGKRTAGIWERVAKRDVKPILIFTAAQPKYRPRLDFAAAAQRAAEQTMPAEFARALSDLIARRGAR